MINLLQSIVEAITSLFGFLIHFVSSLFTFVAQIPTYVAIIAQLVLNLPSVFIPFATAAVTVSVVLWILNRRSNA